MTHIRKVDLNQKEIVQTLRALGYTVRQTHTVGKGFPDICIGKSGLNLLVEIKRPGEGLTPDEKDFFQIWRGTVIVGTDAEQIHNEFVKLFRQTFQKKVHSDEELMHTCGDCGQKLQIVRPGKYQCVNPKCNESR